MVSVFLLGTGYFFLYNVFLTGETTMAGTFQNMGMLLITLAPVISMRLLVRRVQRRHRRAAADAARCGPGRSSLGKYLGAVTILLAITAGTLVDLVPLYLFGTPETTTIVAGYLGFVLLGMACLAVGQLFSTRHPQPDRGRAASPPRCCWRSGSSATCRPSRRRRPCAAWWATCRSRCTSPISSRDWCAREAVVVLPGRLRDRADPERSVPAVAALTWPVPSAPA